MSAPVEKSSSFAGLMSSKGYDFYERGTRGHDWQTKCRSRRVGLIGCDLIQATGFSPAPSAGTGTLEDRACLVSGRTDSITR